MMETMKHNLGRAGRLGLLLALAGAALAAPATNPAGATLEIVTTESDSGGALTNPAGTRMVEFASTDQASTESSAPGGAWLYVGLFDPEPPAASTSAVKLWSLYE